MTMSEAHPTISIVTAVYNEAGNLHELHQRIHTCLQKQGITYEIIFVDDRSMDDSWERIRQLRTRDACVRGLRLSRNFGQHSALTAGLDASRGDYVVLMDADLQDSPELIPQLLEKCQKESFDIVTVVREHREESLFKIASGRIFFSIFNTFSDFKLRPDVGIYRIMSRTVVAELVNLREQARMLTGLTEWIGFSTGFISAKRSPRHSGKTNYTLRKMIHLAMDGLFSFSNMPLRIATMLGLTASAVSLFFASMLIVRKLVWNLGVLGWASLMVTILFMGGIQLTVIGMLGEYLGRIFLEVKRRPLYVVERRLE